MGTVPVPPPPPGPPSPAQAAQQTTGGLCSWLGSGSLPDTQASRRPDLGGAPRSMEGEGTGCHKPSVPTPGETTGDSMGARPPGAPRAGKQKLEAMPDKRGDHRDNPASCLWSPRKSICFARAQMPCRSTSDSQRAPVTEAKCPLREGPSLTFARVSTTLASGCFAGYLAMSHSKWVTKDVKSTGRTQTHFGT